MKKRGSRSGSLEIGKRCGWTVLVLVHLTQIVSGDTGPKWLKVRWPNTRPSTENFQSEPAHTTFGYAYAGYTVPYGHNGNLPRCN
jgi:hypothetical protein